MRRRAGQAHRHRLDQRGERRRRPCSRKRLRRRDRRLLQQADRRRRQVRGLAQESRQRLLGARRGEPLRPVRHASDRGAARCAAPPRRAPRSPRAAAPTAHRCRRLRGPVAVTIASPRTVVLAERQRHPLQRLAGEARRGTRPTSRRRKPQLAGCSGATATPAPLSTSTQPPSEPSCGQLAPPSASTAASALTVVAAVGRIEQKAPCLVPADPAMPQLEADARGIEPPQPGAQQRRGLHRPSETPARSSRRTCPGPAPRTRRAGRRGGNASIAARRCGAAAP